VSTVQHGAVSVLTVDDGKVNAVNHELLDELEPALEQAQARSRAVVLAGRPGVFSGGFDLAVVQGGGPRAAALVERGGRLAARLYASPVPVVVACTGHAVALGAVLLLASDVRIGASGSGTVGLNEVTIGIGIPSGLASLARDRLDARHLTEAVLLARMWTPEEAVEVGFLDEVVPPSEVAGRALAVARDLAGRLQPDAYRATQQALRGATVGQLGSLEFVVPE
jgi:enoyl-CoA hydratase